MVRSNAPRGDLVLHPVDVVGCGDRGELAEVGGRGDRLDGQVLHVFLRSGDQLLEVLGCQRLDALQLVGDRDGESPEPGATGQPVGLPQDVQPAALVEPDVLGQVACLLGVTPRPHRSPVGVDRPIVPALEPLSHRSEQYRDEHPLGLVVVDSVAPVDRHESSQLRRRPVDPHTLRHHAGEAERGRMVRLVHRFERDVGSVTVMLTPSARVPVGGPRPSPPHESLGG